MCSFGQAWWGWSSLGSIQHQLECPEGQHMESARSSSTYTSEPSIGSISQNYCTWPLPVAGVSSQLGSWVLEANISKESDRRYKTFYDLALQNHTGLTLLHSIHRGNHRVPPEFKGRKDRLPLDGEWQVFRRARGWEMLLWPFF